MTRLKIASLVLLLCACVGCAARMGCVKIFEVAEDGTWTDTGELYCAEKK